MDCNLLTASGVFMGEEACTFYITCKWRRPDVKAIRYNRSTFDLFY